MSPAFGKTVGKKEPAARKTEVPSALKRVREEYQKKEYRKAYRNLIPYLRHHPTDWESLYLKALIERKLGQPAGSLKTVKFALRHHPLDYDLLRLGAEDLIDLGRHHEARVVLSTLARKNPNDPIVQADLLKITFPAGITLFNPFFDQHVYYMAGPPAPVVFDSVALTGFDRWSATTRLYGIVYNGGSSFAWDTQATTPLYGDALRFLVGRTEYFGGSAALGSGIENFTYAGADIVHGSLFHGIFEAGDTQVKPSPGLYTHMSSQLGRFYLDVQGYDEMLWGDFGESIIQNGTESGGIFTATYTILPRFWATIQYWYLQYDLDGGTVPWGILHNTMGMLDKNLFPNPSIDLFLGYDSWTTLTENSATAPLIPMVPIQDYTFGGMLARKNFRNLSLQAQAGTFYDDHNVFWGYDLGMGIGYHPIPHLDILGNFTYYNMATGIIGAVEQFSSSVRVTF